MNQKLIKIISVAYLHDYVLKLTFLDGKESVVDFFHFLNTTSNPQIKIYLDLDNFKSYTIKDGELMWGDYDLLFPIQNLYSGKFSV